MMHSVNGESGASNSLFLVNGQPNDDLCGESVRKSSSNYAYEERESILTLCQRFIG